MTLETLFASEESLTAKRKAYAMGKLQSLIRDAAEDLANGDTTRDVAVYAVAAIVAGYIPTTGKGHAEKVRATVSEQIDSYLELEESES